jgi:hypothetical protein
VYADAFTRVCTLVYAFVCILMQPAWSGTSGPAWKLRGVLGRAAHLGRQLVDGLRRDGAVLVGHICVLLACFFFSRAGTFEMHQAENVLECVKFYMPQDQFPGIAEVLVVRRHHPAAAVRGPLSWPPPVTALRVTALRSVSLTCPPRLRLVESWVVGARANACECESSECNVSTECTTRGEAYKCIRMQHM